LAHWGSHVAEVKVRKKDLQAARRPDAVLSSAGSIFDWLWERHVVIFGALVALLVGTGGYTLVMNTLDSKRSAVGVKLSEAADISMRSVVEKPSDEDKDQKGEKPETFTSKAEKTKALNDALTGLVDQNAGTPQAAAAALDLAAVRLSEGKYDEAISLSQKFLDHADGTALVVFANEIQGDAYAAKKDYAKADDSYKKIADAGSPAVAAYNHARLLDVQGKKDEARKAYELVIKDYEKDAVGAEARARIDLLDLPPAGTGALEKPAEPAEPDDAQNITLKPVKPGTKPIKPGTPGKVLPLKINPAKK
jgi:TolA-binding protein